MRSLIALGALLLLLGLFTYLVPMLMSSSQNVVTDLPGMVSTTRANSSVIVPLWASAAAMVAGLLFIILGAAVRPHST